MSGYRVVLDIDRLAADLCVAEERPVRHSEVRDLLKRLGFITIEQGQAWLANADCMAMLTARIGTQPVQLKSSSSTAVIEPESHSDGLIEIQAAWKHLSPAKREEILRAVRGS